MPDAPITASEREELAAYLASFHDKLNGLRVQSGLSPIPYLPDPRNSTDSRMDERTMAFPVYRENERDLLDALNVTSVTLRYDTTPGAAVTDNYQLTTAPLAGVDLTVAGPVTDKQSALLTSWARNRFGAAYRPGRRGAAPVAAVAPVAELPVTFTQAGK